MNDLFEETIERVRNKRKMKKADVPIASTENIERVGRDEDKY